MPQEPHFPIKLTLGVTAGIIAAGAFLGTYFTVDQSQMAVVTRWGGFSYVAAPGLHFKTPFRDGVTKYQTDIQSLTSTKAVNTYTIDNQEVDIVYTVFYRIPVDRVEYVYANNQDYAAKLSSMTVDRLKAALGQVNIQNVAEKRGELRDSIKTTLARDAVSLGLAVTDFQLTDLQYTTAFREAVNNAAVQKAKIESVEYQRQQAIKTAEMAKISAEGEANAARERAKGAADSRIFEANAEAGAIKVQGEAQASAIRAQAEALHANSELVALRKAERWDGKLPVNMYANVPLPFITPER